MISTFFTEATNCIVIHHRLGFFIRFCCTNISINSKKLKVKCLSWKKKICKIYYLCNCTKKYFFNKYSQRFFGRFCQKTHCIKRTHLFEPIFIFGFDQKSCLISKKIFSFFWDPKKWDSLIKFHHKFKWKSWKFSDFLQHFPNSGRNEKCWAGFWWKVFFV